MKVSIICPLYKAKKYIDSLHKSLLMQEDVDVVEVKYLLTDTGDELEKKLEELELAKYEIINEYDFSHSLSREKAGMNAIGDIIVFISQDIIIKDKQWLYKLIEPIKEYRCEATYSRQICDNNSIEKYTRINNYGKESIIVSKDDINSLGIMAFFFSDAASAVRADIYRELKAYDGKDLLTNEDMYFAYKLVKAGYRKMYNAESKVIHSHDYNFKQLFSRYFDQGVFLKDNNYLLEYKVGNSAARLLIAVIKESLKDRNFKVLVNIIPNFAARFLGNKLGQNYHRLSNEKIKKYSSNKNYWIRKFENNVRNY